MIGLFDTGHGGLTVARALRAAFPKENFLYFGDHAHAPYGLRKTEDIIARTQKAVELLFDQGCALVLLACNTATAAALRPMQQDWLPNSEYAGKHNVLGIIAPTVEAITNTKWTDKKPHDGEEKLIAVFGTERTIGSGVYEIEIQKRFPKARIATMACPGLAGAIEAGESEAVLDVQVRDAVSRLMENIGHKTPDHVLLACTHYPLVEPLFRKYLPAGVAIFSQPRAVMSALADYLTRHPEYCSLYKTAGGGMRFLTSGDALVVQAGAERFLGERLAFEALNKKERVA
jgi:glutamate racemase